MRWVTIEVDDENQTGQEVQNSDPESEGDCCVVDRWWVSAERFEQARAEWAKHAAALRARLVEAEARTFAAVSSDGFIATKSGPIHVDDVASVLEAEAEAPATALDAIAAHTQPSIESLQRYQDAGCPLTFEEKERLRMNAAALTGHTSGASMGAWRAKP